MKRLISCLAVGIAFQYALGGISGCSSADPVKKVSAPVAQKNGTLTMELQATSDSGKVYRLRNATFLVSPEFFFGATPSPLEGVSSVVDGGVVVAAGGSTGLPADGGVLPGEAGPGSGGLFNGSGGFPESGGVFTGSGGISFGGFFGAGGSVTNFPGSIVLNSEDDPTAPVIERFLAPSSYDIQLFDGWFVEQVDNLLGTSAAVPATLQSPTFQFFNIQSDQETFVRFDFLVDGSRVSFGPPGRLIIGIGIHETNGGATCGNGIAEAGESCDGADLRGQTCASATMGSAPLGTLFCNVSCNLDTTFCFGGGGFDGGTGGFGGTGGGVGLPTVDAGMGSAAGGAAGAKPIP